MNDFFRLLPNLLNEFNDNPKVREAVIFATWRRVAGDSLAEHAVPMSLQDKHLTVAVTSERWEKYLRDLCGLMIFKINSSLSQPAVTFIDLQVDEKHVQTERKKRGGKAFDEKELRQLARKQVSPTLRARADSIKDNSLRENFLLAAGNCLVRKEKMKKL